MAFSPDDNRLAVAGRTPDLQILDAGTGEPVDIVRETRPGRGKLKFSPDGKRLAAVGYLSGVELWDADTGHVRTSRGTMATSWMLPSVPMAHASPRRRRTGA